MSSQTKHLRFLITLVSCMLSFEGFAVTTADSVILYTPYTKVSVPPGQSVDYPVELINNTREIISADLSLRGLPYGWNYNLKSGGYNIQQVSVLPGERKTFSLSIAVPVKVNKGSYPFRLIASNLSELPLSIVISQQGTFKTEFTTDQVNIQGNNTSVFTYQCILRNSTAEKQLYTIVGDAPRGWNIIFRYNGQQVTAVEVNENNSASINVEIDPPDMIEAGTYRVPIHAANNSSSADLVLEAVIKGSYAMELKTPTGLLSTNITAGDQKRLELVVRNSGSAELKEVQLTASNPVNWDVTFDPKEIDVIEPGKTVRVFAIVKAAKNAIAGDYVTDIEARTTEVRAKAQFRISVETSMLWGWMGILIIVIALGSVYYLFRKYGRR
jgi:uncharacterized membrane protein